MTFLNIPIIRFFEFDTSEISDPSGTRHIEGGSFAFKQRLALGCKHYSGTGTSGTLEFKGLRFNSSSPKSHDISKVASIIISLGSSGVAISDMRLYLKDDSALNYSKDSGLDPAFVQATFSGVWQPNCTLPSGAGIRLSKVVPILPNIKRQDGGNALIKQDDDNVSQYIYCNIVAPWGGKLGSYGVCGSGALTLNLSFSYWDSMYLL